jgi:hypothetical protein
MREKWREVADKIQIENDRIRELIARGYSTQEIKETLGLPDRTYVRRLSETRMGDLKAIADQDDSIKTMIVVNA